MEIKKNMMEHRRGKICILDSYAVKEGKTRDERKQLSVIKNGEPAFYLIMKVLDDGQCLVAKVFKNKYKHTRKICIHRKDYWVRFSEFFVAQKRFLMMDSENQLNDSYKVVSAVYDSHNRYLKEKRKVNSKKKLLEEYWKQVLRESERNRDEYYRMKAPREEICVPDYISVNAKHPFSGGLVSPR